MKKKVMHIVQSPGGVERYILMLLKNMDLSKYDNILVCSFDYDKEKFKDIVVAFEQVDMVREISFNKDISSIINVRRIIKKYNPDVVYMHSSKAGAIGRVANIGLKNKSIYNPHGWAFNMECSKKKKLIYICIEKVLSHFCNNIVAISDYEKKSAVDKRICKQKKIKVINNGIDIEKNLILKSSISREDLNIPLNAYVIGMVGRISMQKAPDIFIKAAALIKKAIPNAYFIIVGDGEMKNEIIKLSENENLKGSIKITGWVNEPMQYIKLFDQAMLLSRWEGFGLVLAEYMLAEKPIIATDVDAISTIILNGVNGMLVAKDDFHKVYEVSLKIKNDEELKVKIVEEGARIIREKYDIKRVANETDDLLTQLINSYI